MIKPIDSTTQYSPAKRTVRNVIASAAVAGTVVYLAKTGRLNPKEGGNKAIEFVKKGLKTPVDLASKGLKRVSDDITFLKKDKLDNFSLKEKAEELYKKMPNLKDSFQNIKGRILVGIDTLRDNIEKRLNPNKFLH